MVYAIKCICGKFVPVLQNKRGVPYASCRLCGAYISYPRKNVRKNLEKFVKQVNESEIPEENLAYYKAKLNEQK